MTADRLKDCDDAGELSSLVDRVTPTEYGQAYLQLGRYFQERLCDLRASQEEEIFFTENDLDSFQRRGFLQILTQLLTLLGESC